MIFYIIILSLLIVTNIAVWAAYDYYHLAAKQNTEIKECIILLDKAYVRINNIRSETLKEVISALHDDKVIEDNDPDHELWEELYGEIAILIADKKEIRYDAN